MSNYSRSIRIPLSLKDTIIKNKGSKSINQYITEQLIGNNDFSEADFDYLFKFISNDLKKTGDKINAFARKLNSEKVKKVDLQIITYIENYIANLQTIKKKKIETIKITGSNINFGKKEYLLRLTLSKRDYEVLKYQIQMSGLSDSDYIRTRLFNHTKYTRFDFLRLKRKLRDNSYRTISNINQIIFRYSKLNEAESLIHKLEEFCDAIQDIEEDILLSWEEYYGNNKVDAHKE